MDLGVPLVTAVLLGSMHAFEGDHMAAVSAFVVRRPGRWAALGFGLRWALGHGAALLVAGVALGLLGRELSDSAGELFERAAGASLLVLGLWTLADARHLHSHRHSHPDGTTHTHLHRHRRPARLHPLDRGAVHEHRHAVTAIGALHGLAGTAPALALLPLASLDSVGAAGGYLLLFGFGTAAGMALYAMFAGWIAGRAALRSARIARAIVAGTGLATSLVGILWLTA